MLRKSIKLILLVYENRHHEGSLKQSTYKLATSGAQFAPVGIPTFDLYNKVHLPEMKYN